MINDYKILLNEIVKANVDVVYGSRVLNKNRYKNNFISNYRILGNHLLTLFSNVVNNQSLSDAHSCYKLFRSDLFKAIKLSHSILVSEITTRFLFKKILLRYLFLIMVEVYKMEKN